MEEMFSGAKEFNKPINKWNTSKVIYLNSMFSHAKKFNQPIDTCGNQWNVGNIEHD